MSSMNQRFRNLVGSKRKPTNNGLTTTNSSASLNTSPNLNQANGNTPPLGTSSDRNSSQSQTPSTGVAAQASASTTSLAMNPNQQPQQPLGRPPSYQYANQGANSNNNNLGAPGGHPQAGRPTSPLPPPINTGANHYAHLPPHQQQMYAQQQPPQAGPPGYPPQQQPQQQQQYGYAPQAMSAPQPGYGRGYPAAVDPNQQRSKAQLIVGIDFVRTARPSLAAPSKSLMRPTGYYFLWCRLRIRYRYRSKRGHYRRVAWCRYSDKTKGAHTNKLLTL